MCVTATEKTSEVTPQHQASLDHEDEKQRRKYFSQLKDNASSNGVPSSTDAMHTTVARVEDSHVKVKNYYRVIKGSMPVIAAQSKNVVRENNEA